MPTIKISEIPDWIDFTIFKGKIPDSVLKELPYAIRNGSITEESYKLRLTHFLSQCSHESGGFTVSRENLNYSAQGLLETFPTHFTPQEAKDYARQPDKIANRVYGNRMGNGDEASGDGWKYRGRGALQLTGKNDYRDCGIALEQDFLNFPDLVATNFFLQAATWEFDRGNLWAICEQGNSNEVIKNLTKKINGGYNGLTDRINLFREFEKLIG